MLNAVEHSFGVEGTRQGGPRADNGHNIADGISALSVGIGCTRADAVGTVDRDGLLRHVCVCVWIPSRCALQRHRVCEGYPQPVAFHDKNCTPHLKAFLQLWKPN